MRGVLFLALAGHAFGGPFPHELHLKLKPLCIACHTGVPNSTRVEDNLLPDRSACLPCHTDPSIKSPTPTLLAHFSHKTHLALGNIAPLIRSAIDHKTYLGPPGDVRRHLFSAVACSACHRALDESSQVMKASFPNMADCLICHTKIDPPFSCELCHDKSAKLKPASHTGDFFDRHSKPAVQKGSCAICHGRKFTCQGCH